MRRTFVALALTLAANSLLAQAPATHRIITIAEAIKTLNTGDTVTVAGRATAGSGQLQSTVFDIALEDSTGGIRVFSRTLEDVIKVGDSIVTSGVVKAYRGNLEIVGSSLQVIDGVRRVIRPVDIAVDQKILPRYQGRLVRVHGRVAGFGQSEGGQYLRLRDLNPEESGTLTIWVPSNHGEPIDLSRVRFEDSVTVSGVISSYRDNTDDPLVWQIIPRTREDINVPIVVAESVPPKYLYVALVISLFAAAWLYSGRYRAYAQVRGLRETETRYRQLLALSPDAVLVFASGSVRFANPAAARLLGFQSEEQLSGRSVNEFVPEEFRAALDAPPGTHSDEKAIRIRGQLRSQTGRTVDVELTASPCVYLDHPATVMLARDITQQLRYERDLHALALVDELTGLANRRGYHFFAESEVARARREKRSPVVVFADIDGLKAINDSHGHTAGDTAIRIVAQAFKSILRESDIVARWGGDEFVALIGEGGEAAAAQIGARLGGAIAALRPAGIPFAVRASVGVSHLDPSLPLQEAMERADQELYRKKGRNSGETKSV